MGNAPAVTRNFDAGLQSDPIPEALAHATEGFRQPVLVVQKHVGSDLFRGTRRELIVEDQVVNSRSRGHVRLERTVRDAAALVDIAGGVSVLPRDESGFAHHVDFDVIVGLCLGWLGRTFAARIA